MKLLIDIFTVFCRILKEGKLHNDLCLDLLENICKPVNPFKVLHNTVHISINNIIFKHFSAKTCNIYCRRKLQSIKSEKFESVNWKQ